MSEMKVAEFMSRDAQSSWMRSLRPATVRNDLIYNDGTEAHPFSTRFAPLEHDREAGVPAGNGYARARPTAVRRRYAYDRAIVRAIEEAGGFFAEDPSVPRARSRRGRRRGLRALQLWGMLRRLGRASARAIARVSSSS